MATQAVDLSSAPASGRSRIMATVLVAMLVSLSVAVGRNATLAGPVIPAFLPAIYSAALLAYALTSFLFANQYVTSRSPGFALLSIAYAYAFVLTVPYLLAFPGVFSQDGLIGSRSTSGTLYVFTHAGYAALLIGYAFVELRTERRGRASFRADRFVGGLAALVAIATGAALWFALRGSLTVVAPDGHYTQVYTHVLAPSVIALYGIATVALVQTLRGGKTIPLWTMVVCIVNGLEVLVSTLGGGRYTDGWYFSRFEAAVAAGLMLCVFLYYINIALLLQANNLRQLALARDAAQRSAEEKAALLRDYEREQRVAASFQRAALPSSLPRVAGISFDGFYASGKSEALVGGDWFDALRLPDGRIVLSIGDVAGSGLDAAVIMAKTRQAIRGIAHVHTDPAMILEAADRVLRAEHPERFVTAFVGLFDQIYGTLTYATAGHNRPFVRAPDGTISELGGSGLPLGLRVRGDAHHVSRKVEAGTLFVFYTDGLVESTHDAEEGERRLREAVARLEIERTTRAARDIYDAVLVNGSRDDVAILTMYVSTARHCDEAQAGVGRWRFASADGAAAREVRGHMLALLEEHGVRGADCIAAEVVFSELVGNVVRYAPGDVEVLLDCTSAAPVLHVLDEGPGFSRFPELPRHLYSESGRGLYIVATLADEFTVTRRPEQGSHARAVLNAHPSRDTR